MASTIKFESMYKEKILKETRNLSRLITFLFTTVVILFCCFIVGLYGYIDMNPHAASSSKRTEFHAKCTENICHFSQNQSLPFDIACETDRDCYSYVSPCSYQCESSKTLKCINLPDRMYKCECIDGYEGKKCEKKIPPCSWENWCIGEDSTCRKINADPGWECICENGYYGYRCSYRDRDESICSRNEHCSSNGECVYYEERGQCVCQNGFRGRWCEIDESKQYCSLKSCLNEGTCIPQKDKGFTCICDWLYQGQRCEHIYSGHPCDSKPCENGGKCSRSLSNSKGYECYCEDRYSGKNCQHPVTIPLSEQKCREPYKFPDKPQSQSEKNLANVFLNNIIANDEWILGADNNVHYIYHNCVRIKFLNKINYFKNFIRPNSTLMFSLLVTSQTPIVDKMTLQTKTENYRNQLSYLAVANNESETTYFGGNIVGHLFSPVTQLNRLFDTIDFKVLYFTKRLLVLYSCENGNVSYKYRERYLVFYKKGVFKEESDRPAIMLNEHGIPMRSSNCIE